MQTVVASGGDLDIRRRTLHLKTFFFLDGGPATQDGHFSVGTKVLVNLYVEISTYFA